MAIPTYQLYVIHVRSLAVVCFRPTVHHDDLDIIIFYYAAKHLQDQSIAGRFYLSLRVTRHCSPALLNVQIHFAISDHNVTNLRYNEQLLYSGYRRVLMTSSFCTCQVSIISISVKLIFSK